MSKNYKDKPKTEEELACIRKIIVYKNTNLNNSAFRILTTEDELTKYLRLHYYINPDKINTGTFSKYQNDKLIADVYENITYDSIDNTLKYVFSKMKTGIFVRIFNNQLTHFIPVYNTNFINDYAEFIKFKEGDVVKYINKKKESIKYLSKVKYDTRKWNATNCLLRNEFIDNDPTIAYLHEFYNMIINTCRHRKVADCIFFINRKDFPYLKKDYTESYDHIFGSDNYKMKAPYDKYSYIPIVSQSSSDLHADLTMPTADDWDIITQELFINGIDSCSNPYLIPKGHKFPEWDDRQSVVIWRGSGTGCGSTIDDNPRLKLTFMSQELKKKGINYLDAGIVNFTKRDKKTADSKYVTFEKSIDGINFASFVNKFDQTNYKFTINVEGNSAAYRYGSLFAMGFCILNIETKYKLWFEKFLEPYVHYVPIKNDLSDLIKQIEWCLANDNKCKIIAENAKIFYDKYFTREFVYDYMADMMNGISRKYTNYKLEQKIDFDVIKKFYTDIFHPVRAKLSFETIKYTQDRENNHDVLIIVPYRDNAQQNRAEQLKKFISHCKDYDVLIVEQSDDNRKFNRGALLNIGVNYARKQEGWNYKSFIFHDVDILMNVDIMKKYYTVPNDGIVHFGRLTPKYTDFYPHFLGAILKVDSESYFKFNGYPNTFWGWGSEDDASIIRISKVGLTIKRPDEPNNSAVELPHIDTNKLKNLVQENRYENIILDNDMWQMNGIKQCTFNLLKTVDESKYIKKITVEIL